MYSEIDAYQDEWSWDSADGEVLKLAEETTELGIAVEDAYKNAASALYSTGIEAARLVESGGDAPDARILAKIVAVMRHPALSGKHFRRIAELQHVASEFAHIGEHARAIAGHALALRGVVESELSELAADVYELLRVLVRQTYIVIRGSIVVSSSRDPHLAERVLAAAADLDGIYLDFLHAVQHAIARHDTHTLHLQHLLLAGRCMQEIADQSRGICRAVVPDLAPAVASLNATPYN
jgi:hypothetical protein